MVMWDVIAAEVAQEFPDVRWDKMLVDVMTVRMTLKPQSLETAAQMLEHLGEGEAAARLMRAVETVTAQGVLTPDVGGTATTQQVTDAVCQAIRASNV